MATKKTMLYAASFGDLVRRLREEREMSPAVLARRAGLPHSTISGVESGRSGASLEIARKIAAGLGVKLSEMERHLPPVKAGDPEAAELPRGRRPKASTERA